MWVKRRGPCSWIRSDVEREFWEQAWDEDPSKGQPGDRTEVDHSGTKGMCSSKTPIICRSEEREPSLHKVSSWLYFSTLSPSLFWEWKSWPCSEQPVCSLCSSAVFKVYNMRQDLYTGQRSSRTYWDLLRGVLQSALVISPTLCPPAFLTSVSLPLKTCQKSIAVCSHRDKL